MSRTVTVQDVVFGGSEVIVMAGPCAVESREQVFAAAAGRQSLTPAQFEALMTSCRRVAEAVDRTLRTTPVSAPGRS